MERQCKITPGGGKISIQLSADNGIISGGKFAIGSGDIVKPFEMHTDTTGKDRHTLEAGADALVDKVMNWDTLNCSGLNTTECTLSIQIFQDGVSCAMNKEAKYILKDIPACKDNLALPVKGGLRFVKQFTAEQ